MRDLSNLVNSIVDPEAFHLGAEKTPSGSGVRDQSAFSKTLVAFIEANFPNALKASKGEVVVQPLGPGVRGDYSPLSGKIRISPRALKGTYGPAVTVYRDKTGKEASQKVEFTTEDIMEAANTMLHELYHGASNGGFKAVGPVLSPEAAAKVNSMQQRKDFTKQPFTSVNTNSFDSEEFMANASALLQLAQAGAIVDGSVNSKQLANLKDIMQNVPEVKQFIDARLRPELPSIKPVPAPITEQIQKLLSDLLK
jgi:hypothetical protein